MVDEKLGLTLIFNGTIYNYKSLRALLISHGYRFFSNSDTEVIIKAYHYWGEGCLERLDGMFAFAIWDEATQKLFVARDRMGIKPFYFNATDLVVLSSLWEGSPNVIKESMSCNTPVVSTDVGDVREIINSAQGCFISDSSSENFSKAIEMSLLNKQKIDYRNVIYKYRSEYIAIKIINIYKNLHINNLK